MVKISIIIPIYKVEQYLPQCLNSCIEQTFKDWEAICVNDGSPDKCGEILQKYAKNDSRIKVITQKNQGISAARNVAFKHAKGSYIVFLDSDDELSSIFLEKMYGYITTTKSDVVACKIMQGLERKKWEFETSDIQTFFTPFESYIKEDFKICTSVWAKIWKSSILKKLTFKTELSQGGEDLFYLYQALYQTKKIAITHERLYFYRIRPNSVMTSKLSQKFVRSNIKTAELIQKYFENKSLSQKVRKILNSKNAKRIFKFGVLEPKRKDKKNLAKWYDYTRPILVELKKTGYYQPKYLDFKNRIKSWLFFKGI